ncbi:MAG: nicotinate phosphoribosyltransferase [Verrucomicrobia subdivision 3 bacterium]|nr:nicotinate phosphoribosyltransferase [Limisphaerales bacterium]
MNLWRQARVSLALLTDLYQLTMAYAYWKSGTHRKEAAFHLFFRKNPFHGGYAVACGLEDAAQFLSAFRFDESDLDYLASLKGNDGNCLFERAFLDDLRELRFRCDLDAIPEGTLVFANEPLLRVTGPIMQCQLLETALLNIVNFQTLIATKAARICHAAQGEPVIEFGLRRAQGVDGGVTASRAAFVGGCAGTSNVLAGKVYGIPVKGTHAHSWVMSFDSEPESFRAYAEAMPNNCIFLVDTYDSLQGVRHAIEAGKWLRSRGKEMVGIRLDSGDLAWLSIEARKLLDEAGFTSAVIVGSNDLDEKIIASLKEQGSRISVWGVGTKLATAYDQPALGGVYKLTAVREPGGEWQPRLKLSEQAVKISTPGLQQVRRFEKDGEFMGDVIYNTAQGCATPCIAVDPLDSTRRKTMPEGAACEDLLVPVFRGGKQVSDSPALPEIQKRTRDQLQKLHSGTKRLLNPHEYPVGLELQLHELKTRLVMAARGSVK